MLSGGGRPMSALGQKATCAPQKVMSALPQKADMCISPHLIDQFISAAE